MSVQSPPIFSIPDLEEPKEEKDKEKKDKKKSPVKLPQKFSELFADNIFKSIAIVGGPHWKLSTEDKRDLGVALKPVMEKHLEFFIKWMIEINCMFAFARIIGEKTKVNIDAVKEKQNKEGVTQLQQMIENAIDKKIKPKDKKSDDLISKKEQRAQEKKLELQEELIAEKDRELKKLNEQLKSKTEKELEDLEDD